MKIKFSKKSVSFIKKCEKELKKRLLEKIESLQSNPFPSDSKRIMNQKDKIFRIRIGDYRVLYEVLPEKEIILIADINKRSKIY